MDTFHNTNILFLPLTYDHSSILRGRSNSAPLTNTE